MGVAAPPPPPPVAPLRVLLTNDDGVHAPGLDALARALRVRPGVRLTIVAPATNQSGTGGRTTRGRLRARRTTTASGLPAIAVAGTPSDSARYALAHGPRDARPDLVVSGINDGANLGRVVEVSGTVGAARAAARAGLPALATSQGRLDSRPTAFAPGVRRTVAWFDAHRDALVPGTVTNLNTPGCARGTVRGVVEVRLARRSDRRTYGAVDCARRAPAPATDTAAFLAGFATVTAVSRRPATR